MILTCPSCAARFLVASAAIGAEGRDVRCGRCSHSWVATPTDDADADVKLPPIEVVVPTPEPDTAPSFNGPNVVVDNEPSPIQAPSMHATDPEMPLRPEAHPQSRANVPAVRPLPRRWPARLAWIALIAVLIGIGAVASVYRDAVVAVLPAAKPLYALVGVDQKPVGFGLNLIIDSSDQPEKDGQKILRVSGRIENTTGSQISIPDLRAVLFDAEERELQGWTFSAPVSSLLPNQNASFKTELVNPAKNAVRLSIIFHESKQDVGRQTHD